jgi:hypothetical protein
MMICSTRKLFELARKASQSKSTGAQTGDSHGIRFAAFDAGLGIIPAFLIIAESPSQVLKTCFDLGCKRQSLARVTSKNHLH